MSAAKAAKCLKPDGAVPLIAPVIGHSLMPDGAVISFGGKCHELVAKATNSALQSGGFLAIIPDERCPEGTGFSGLRGRLGGPLRPALAFWRHSGAFWVHLAGYPAKVPHNQGVIWAFLGGWSAEGRHPAKAGRSGLMSLEVTGPFIGSPPTTLGDKAGRSGPEIGPENRLFQAAREVRNCRFSETAILPYLW